MSCYLLKAKPSDVLDYKFDWTSELGNDTISSSEWSVDAGMTIDSDTHNDSIATVWLSGGVSGSVYKAVNKITTANARTISRSLAIRVG